MIFFTPEGLDPIAQGGTLGQPTNHDSNPRGVSIHNLRKTR